MERDLPVGINLKNLEEAFVGSEDVLLQMLTLFQVQAAERMQQLGVSLAEWDVLAVRTVLHSLVNISGAVRAYGMSELAKAMGDAIKRDDPARARELAHALAQESVFVLAQVKAMLAAAHADPRGVWTIEFPHG